MTVSERPANSCPDRDELAAYLSGRLSVEDLERVAAHVSDCPPCEVALLTVPQRDTLASALRHCLDGSAYDADPVVARLEARACRVGREPAGLTLAPALSGNEDAQTADEWFPRDFGKFRLLAKLGRGGMGVVYKAQEVWSDRTVALKVVRAGAHAAPEELARFQVEARAVARLNHPNVVPMYEAGTHDGLPYYTMELLEAGSLAQRLKVRGLPAQEATRLVETLARAVHAAHAKGIVHRDLKPGNVLLTADGNPKVADFGLAKLLDAEQAATNSNVALGTPAYMAPEQAKGASKGVGPAADVYALGAILYELICGRPPFHGDGRLAVLDQLLRHELMPPSHWRPGVDRVLEAICLKCLEMEPARRYATAEALADDLRRWQAGDSTEARPLRWPGRAWRALRRRRVTVAVALALALVAVLGIFAVVLSDPDRPVRQLEARLARNEKVVLIPELGGPAWSRWRIGEAGRGIGPDGHFQLQSWTFSVLELLRDPQVNHYRVHAEIRHEVSQPGHAPVGLVVCLREQAAAAPAFLMCKLTYEDVNDSVEIYKRHIAPLVKDRTPPPQGNQVHLGGRLYVPGGQGPYANAACGDLSPELFRAAGPGKSAWRKLTIEVSLQEIRGWWCGIPVGRLTPRDLTARTAEVVGRQRQRLGDGFFGRLDPAPELRGGIGLCIDRGAASVRNVEIEPVEDAN
jgi:serine/threonine-protein kinase